MNKKAYFCAAAVFLLVFGAWIGTSRIKAPTVVPEGTSPGSAPESEAFSKGTDPDVSAGEGQTRIHLDQEGCVIQGNGVLAEEGRISILQGGTYLIDGTLKDGQLYIDTGSDEAVKLVFDGMDITNESAAAVYVEKAGKTEIILAEGTVNRLQSGRTAKRPEEAEEARGGALYVRNDLTITGTGMLQVYGYLNNGIHSTAQLSVNGGNIQVEARNNGFKGKNMVSISGGQMTVTAEGKGICADQELLVQGSQILVARSNEGFEANQITIEGGNVEITAEDDGINACGGAGSDGKPEKMPNLRISGGTVSVNAEGDGLDSNGNLFVEGGTVVIDGPSADDDGALDYGSENGGVCQVHGGTVLAIGSRKMAVTFEKSSGQCSLRWILDRPYGAGDQIEIADGEGKVLYRHEAVKRGASVIFSSSQLKSGETYILKAGDQTARITLDSISADLGAPIPEPKKPDGEENR